MIQTRTWLPATTQRETPTIADIPTHPPTTSKHKTKTSVDLVGYPREMLRLFETSLPLPPSPRQTRARRYVSCCAALSYLALQFLARMVRRLPYTRDIQSSTYLRILWRVDGGGEARGNERVLQEGAREKMNGLAQVLWGRAWVQECKRSQQYSTVPGHYPPGLVFKK